MGELWHTGVEDAPEGELLLVFQQMTGFCLREKRGGDWYDEHENFDDSELEITHWMNLPEHPDD